MYVHLKNEYFPYNFENFRGDLIIISAAIPENVGCYLRAVGCYRTKVSQLEATRFGLLRTPKISRIDPIVAKL